MAPLLSAFVSPLPVSGRVRHGLHGDAAVCRQRMPACSTRHLPVMTAKSPVVKSAVNLDWANLGFEYIETRCYATATCKDGVWGAVTLVDEPYVRMHIAATALHYGCACFEGLKCFRTKDGAARLFRPTENAHRMQESAKRLMIPPVPTDMFLDAVSTAVRENAEFIPPYGTGGSLYVRPLLFGSGARIGLQPGDEFTFIVMVVPVGDYYKGGLSPVTSVVTEGFDRAAPRGLGSVKVGGNYAADLLPNTLAKRAGYPINLYLDALGNQTIEEFGTSNFVALKGNSYITPGSSSVLPSITNKTLMQLAEDRGMVVEKREVNIQEVKDFEEVAACGTAVVITVISRIVHGSTVYEIGPNPDAVGPRFRELFDEVRGIQQGEVEDMHGWCVAVDGA